MSEDEMKRKAVELVQEAKPNAIELRASLIDEVFHGVVALVDYSENNKQGRNYVYFTSNGKASLSQSSEAFIRSLSGRSSRNVLRDSANLIAGIIAVIVTVTICYLVITRTNDYNVPEVLSGALTLILGFYFGSTTKNDK